MHKDQMRELNEAVRSCRAAGKKKDFNGVLKSAEAALELIQSDNNGRQGSFENQQKRKLQKASVFGYKGLALLKKDKFEDALSCLEESQSLRSQVLLEQKQGSSACTTTLTELQLTLHQREAKVVTQSLKICYQQLGKTPPLPSLLKYPRTTHLFDSGGTATTTDDLVLPDFHSILHVFCSGKEVVIEEKVDGANLGISLCPFTGQLLVQNRSHYISHGEHAQFHRISEWIAEHRISLTEILQTGSRILYGEWMVARHSIPYKRLPGFFVAFDIFDKTSGKFFSRRRFHSTMRDTRIPVVPVITTKKFAALDSQRHNRERYQTELKAELVRMLETESRFRSDGGTVEGIVVRVDDDSRTWLDEKFKVVRPDFVRGCGEGKHWATRQIEKQAIDFEFAEEYLKVSCVCADGTD